MTDTAAIEETDANVDQSRKETVAGKVFGVERIPVVKGQAMPAYDPRAIQGIGVAELIGEGLTATVSDRVGLKRALFWGLGLTVLSYLGLPFLDTSLAAAMTGLAFLFLAFEFTMVTSLSLSTEILPEFRATMMAGFLATAGLGRVLGALMGGIVWQNGGIWAISWLSGGLTLLGWLCLACGFRGSENPEP